MTNIIVGHPFDISQSHGKHWLSTIKRLYLTLLVNAQNHSFVRRVQVQAHNISHFLNKERVCGEFEMVLTMGLETKSSPDPMHGGTRQFSIFGRRTDGPMRSFMRFGLKGFTDKHGNFFIRDRSRSTRTQFVMETCQSILDIALTTVTDALSADSKFLGNGIIRNTISAEKHNVRSSHKSMWQRPGIRNSNQLFLFLIGQYDRLFG